MLSFDPSYYPYASQRKLVYSSRGMVASSHPLATEAGMSILRKGGNAVDAALAVAGALTVVDPSNNGIGGDCFAIINMKGEKLAGLNASGFSPALLNKEEVLKRGYNKIPFNGWLPVTVPGAPAGWAALNRRYGTMPLTELFAPAIEYAKQGYALSADNAYMLNLVTKSVQCCGEEFPELREWLPTFNPSGKRFHAGELYTLPDMASSLERLAKSDCLDIYEGELAEHIDAFSRATGGLLRKADLSKYAARWVDPIGTSYRGYEVWELPPNGQGATALIALNILENFEFDTRDSVRTLHTQMEAIKLAFSDALHYIADPAYMPLPIEALLDKEYGKRRSLELNPNEASIYAPGKPAGSDTVYFCVADGQGNSISLIQSLFRSFGSLVTIPGTGVSLQDRGACFSMADGHANQVAPNKYPYHTIIPAFLTKGGEPVGPFGIMGGYMQPQAHVQAVMNMVDFGLNPQAALDAPRFCWNEGLSFNMEPGYNAQTISALIRKGHDIHTVDGIGYGRGQMIFNTASGTLCAATEPRADGSAMGY